MQRRQLPAISEAIELEHQGLWPPRRAAWRVMHPAWNRATAALRNGRPGMAMQTDATCRGCAEVAAEVGAKAAISGGWGWRRRVARLVTGMHRRAEIHTDGELSGARPVCLHRPSQC